jgi:hypothetical protein
VPIADIVSYSITSSAMAITPDGMVSPSALAVLRLITSSNLVGRATGRSHERGQRIQIRRRVVTDQIDRPCAEQDKRRSDGDDGGPDPITLARLDNK